MPINKKTKIVLVPLALVLALSGIGYVVTHRNIESTDNAYVHADITPLTAKVEGYVKDLKVADNQLVHKGDVLLELDARDYNVQHDQLKAQLASREAALQVLQSRVSVQRSQVQQVEASLVASRADAERADSDAKRFGDLFKEQYATAQRAEATKADATKARAQVEVMVARIGAEKDQLQSLAAQIEQAKADVAQARAALDQVENSQRDTQLVAPVDGIVGNRSVQVGTLVKPGMQLAVLMQPKSVFVQANFKETQITRMHPGQPVHLKVDAYPGKDFVGEVESLSPASGAQFSMLPQDNATGNFTKIVQRIPVKIRVMAPADYSSLLKPGMSVEAAVDTSSNSGAK